MNIEFLLLAADYLKTLRRRDAFLEWGLAILIGFVTFILNYHEKNIDVLLKNLCSSAVSLLGILVGFGIAIITLLNTATNSNIQEIKTKMTENFLGTKRLNLFEIMLINFSYSIVIGIFLLIINIFIPSLLFIICNNFVFNIILSIDIFLTCHMLLLTLRNMTNFYFVLIK